MAITTLDPSAAHRQVIGADGKAKTKRIKILSSSDGSVHLKASTPLRSTRLD